MQGYFKCKQQKVDCFGIQKNQKASGKADDTCMILNDTDFKKPCPFYKTVKEYEAGKKKYPYDHLVGK